MKKLLSTSNWSRYHFIFLGLIFKVFLYNVYISILSFLVAGVDLSANVLWKPDNKFKLHKVNCFEFTTKCNNKVISKPQSIINFRQKLVKQFYFRNQIENRYKRKVKNPETAAKLIPNFSMGCKRISPSIFYLKVWIFDNLLLVTNI